jgi:hypothetical protein
MQILGREFFINYPWGVILSCNILQQAQHGKRCQAELVAASG